MSYWQKYYLAQSVDDALQTLVSAPGDALLIGGGTDLLLDLQQGRHKPVHTLVDVTEIPELTILEIQEGELYIVVFEMRIKVVDPYLPSFRLLVC